MPATRPSDMDARTAHHLQKNGALRFLVYQGAKLGSLVCEFGEGWVAMEAESGGVAGAPDPAAARASAIAEFARFVRDQRLADVDELDYSSLHDWSVGDLDGFWAAAAEFLGVRFHAVPEATLDSLIMPGTEWFPGSPLNYAEHALTDGP